MTQGLERRYGANHLHFITCSCYQRRPLLDLPSARDCFVEALGGMRARYGFKLVGYVVMPEHVHLMISEPPDATPSDVMRDLKQRVAFSLLERGPFWVARFYDFNVWSEQKRNEKLHYMHMNPVKRRLVKNPKDWPWSSYRFFTRAGKALLSMDLNP
jgi:putative transposase